MINKEEMKEMSMGLLDISKRLRTIRVQMIRIRYKEEKTKNQRLVKTVDELESLISKQNHSVYAVDDLIDQIEILLNINI